MLQRFFLEELKLVINNFLLYFSSYSLVININTNILLSNSTVPQYLALIIFYPLLCNIFSTIENL